MYCFLVLLHTKACGFHLQPLASHYKKDAKNGNFCSYNTWYHLYPHFNFGNHWVWLYTVVCFGVFEFSRGCRCSSICVAKHEFEKVQRFVLVFGQIQVQSSNFSWMGSSMNPKLSFDIFGGWLNLSLNVFKVWFVMIELWSNFFFCSLLRQANHDKSPKKTEKSIIFQCCIL